MSREKKELNTNKRTEKNIIVNFCLFLKQEVKRNSKELNAVFM